MSNEVSAVQPQHILLNQATQMARQINVAADSHAAPDTHDSYYALSRSATPAADGTRKPTPPRPPQKGGDARLAVVEDARSLVVPGGFGGAGLQAIAVLAAQQGLHWYKAEEMTKPLLEQLEGFRKKVHTALNLPEPYLKGFHGFSERANLQYLHALNMEPAIAQFAGISVPGVKGGAAARQEMLRLTAEQIKAYVGNSAKLKNVVDMGCGTGVTSCAFAKHFPTAKVIGLDASDYMLAEAQRLAQPQTNNLEWRHRLAQDTQLQSNSQDVVVMVFMAHEQPRHIMDAVLKEAYRVLKPGGVLAVSDYDTERPLVRFIAHMPGVVADLASTLIFEPHLNDYLHNDFAKSTQDAGFVDFEHQKTCANVQLLLARKPKP